MGGKKRPRPKDRIRNELLALLQQQREGKIYITPMLRIQAITLLGVVDGVFPPDAITRQRRDKRGCPPAHEAEEIDYDPEVQEIRNKFLEEQNGRSDGNGSTSSGL
jgi:hypothetical protein